MESKQEYQARLEAQLEKWAVTIGDFVGRAERATVEAKADYQRHIDELQARQAAARRKLAELKASTGDAWQDVRTGVEQAWDDLRAALERAAARFKAGS